LIRLTSDQIIKLAMRIITIFILLGFLSNVSAQNMNTGKLHEIISQVSDTIASNGNSIQFSYRDRPLICVYDGNANRMRIISPIVERKEIGEKELLNAMVANFHSALDVKYALSDEIIWAVFIHPLKELSDHQVLDAIEQVYNASINFGTTYSSTNLVFPGNTKKNDSIKRKIIIEKG